MVHIDGGLGDHVADFKRCAPVRGKRRQMELERLHRQRIRMQVVYRQFISEFNLNRKDTVGLNDISIVGLAKTLNRPLVSMEKKKH